ncbi:DUF1987 domain-containing protein [Fulvivirga sp.]|uniref:DUF1987 domain-containing protein n=1 Tax=Fulvivirga sp. TaxID=1931237 RepID=UPI0032EAE0F1
MKTFLLEATEDSPLVYLNADKGELVLRGRSYMEDTLPFQKPIIDWLRNYVQKPRPYNSFKIELDYINSASHQMVLSIVSELNKYFILGKNFEVIWTYQKEDEYMEDLAQEMKEMFDLPIKELVLV